MSEPKTPNLGLNKIDRSSPSTTYFDLDKYLDQNWEKIDGFTEQVEEKVEETATKVSGIQERLDVEKRKSVTLEPGLQIIHAERASAFKFEGMKGRTLVNLLGRDGGFESMNGWFTTAGVSSELDWSLRTQGNQSVKISLKEGSTGGSLYKLLGQTLSTSKNYIALADLKKGTSTNISLSLWDGTSNVSGTVVTTDQFSAAVLLIPAGSLGTTTNNLQISIVGSAAGQFGHADAVRVYEITSEELKVLSNMSAEKVATKYPYVDSVQPVHNPYVIRYGENLLPPFYEWEHTGHIFGETSPYTAKGELISASMGTDAYAVTYLNILPNQNYTISNPSKSTGKIRVSVYDSYARLQGMFINPGETKTIKTYTTAVRMGVNCSGVTQYTDDFDVSKWIWSAGNNATFVQPIMTLGETITSHKVREDAILALQSSLYADPVTNENADEVFEKNGQLYKISMWSKVSLDNNLTYRSVASSPGYKIVGCTLSQPVAAYNRLIVTKYNGHILTRNPNMTGADNAYFRIADLSDFNISISNADSGWGDSYTPSIDEIKAYFMGWVMFNGSAGTGSGNSPDVPSNNVYNGLGTKWWVCRSDGRSNNWVSSTNLLPTQPAKNYTSYQLVYQVSKPIIEPIQTEGYLTFFEGDNQIEVGSGLEFREDVRPVFTSNDYNSYNINNYNQSSKLKNKVKKIMSIYKNDIQDYWDVLRFSPESEIYGRELASLPALQFDSSALYSVTYQSLGDFFSVPMTGSVGVSEKTVIDQLINDSSGISKKLSVLEGKSNDKELKNFVEKNYLSKSTSIIQNDDLNNFVKEGEFYCQLNSVAETIKNCPVGIAFSLKVSKNGTQDTGNIPGVTQTLITFLPVGFTTWQRNLYETWGEWVKVPSREEFESLKSSVSDGKTAIAAAITGKGVTASGSDTFLQLSNSIAKIRIGVNYNKMSYYKSQKGTVQGTDGFFTTDNIFTFPSRTERITYITKQKKSSIASLSHSSDTLLQVIVALRNVGSNANPYSSGNTELYSYNGYQGSGLRFFDIDFVNREITIQYDDDYQYISTNKMEKNLNNDSPIIMYVAFYFRNAAGGSYYVDRSMSVSLNGHLYYS